MNNEIKQEPENKYSGFKQTVKLEKIKENNIRTLFLLFFPGLNAVHDTFIRWRAFKYTKNQPWIKFFRLLSILLIWISLGILAWVDFISILCTDHLLFNKKGFINQTEYFYANRVF